MSAIETVNSGSISGWVKPKAIKVGIQFRCLTFSIERDSVKLLPCVADRWAGGSLTRKPKVPFAVFSPSKLGE